nr:hypothetical protein [Tanacetum cinerariifolium]
MKRHKNIAYEMFRGRAPDISYFHVFGCLVQIRNHRYHLGKFDEKADNGFFLGYSPVVIAFKVFNIRRQEMEETFHVTFSKDDEAISQSSIEALDEVAHLESAANFESNDLQEDDIDEPIDDQHALYVISPLAVSGSGPPVPQDRWSRDKHIDLVNIIGEPLASITNKSRIRDSNFALASECIDYDETFSPVARLEAIRIFLAYASYMGFTLYQIDMKSAFLNGKISKEVYMEQPLGFESSEFPNHVCKLNKALYGMEQAPRAWYLKGTLNLGLWYPKGLGFDLKAYSDSDYIGCNLDRKSTSEGCQIFKGKLPVTQPKAPTAMNPRKKKIPSSTQPKVKSMHASKATADMQECSDSDMQSMPYDELKFVLGFETADSDNLLDNEVSTSDHIVQDDNAFAKRVILPDHMDHICEKVSFLHSKLGDMESSIAEINYANLAAGRERPSRISKEPTPPRDESKWKCIAIEELPRDELVSELKRLSDLKAQEEKSEEELNKLLNQATLKAQGQKWNEHEEKKSKMIKDFKHQIAFRADPLPITKMSYVVNSRKDTTIKITRGNDPLNLIKRKGAEFVKEVFVTEDVKVDRIGKNLIPPPGVIPIHGLVISEPELGIFFMNGKVMKGLSECKALKRNVKLIQAKDIVKEVEDHLKTYLSAGRDIS